MAPSFRWRTDRNPNPISASTRRLRRGITTVSDRYDVIVIDTPPALSYVTTNALYAADGIIVPVPPAMMDFASASLFFSFLGDIQKVIDENEGGEKVFDFLGLLISKYEPGNFVHQTIHDWVRATFQQRVLFHTMGTSTSFAWGRESRLPMSSAPTRAIVVPCRARSNLSRA